MQRDFYIIFQPPFTFIIVECFQSDKEENIYSGPEMDGMRDSWLSNDKEVSCTRFFQFHQVFSSCPNWLNLFHGSNLLNYVVALT